MKILISFFCLFFTIHSFAQPRIKARELLTEFIGDFRANSEVDYGVMDDESFRAQRDYIHSLTMNQELRIKISIPKADDYSGLAEEVAEYESFFMERSEGNPELFYKVDRPNVKGYMTVRENDCSAILLAFDKYFITMDVSNTTDLDDLKAVFRAIEFRSLSLE